MYCYTCLAFTSIQANIPVQVFVHLKDLKFLKLPLVGNNESYTQLQSYSQLQLFKK